MKYVFIGLGVLAFLYFIIHAFNTNMFGSAWIPILLVIVAIIFTISYAVKKLK